MKEFDIVRKILRWSFVGFFCGIIFANFLADSYIVQSDLFSEYYLRLFLKERTLTIEYAFYLILKRVIPVLLLIAVQHINFSKSVVWLFVVWTGFSMGLLISVELMNLGAMGILFFMAGLFPQWGMYVIAFLIIFTGILKCEPFSFHKAVRIVVIYFAGILCEFFVNPILMKTVIRLIF